MGALKSTAVSAWAKSKDAAGHEHDSSTGQFTSGGGDHHRTAVELRRRHPVPAGRTPHPILPIRVTPEAQAAYDRQLARHKEEIAADERNGVASAMVNVFDDRARLVKLPGPGATPGQRVARFRAAAREVQVRRDYVDMLASEHAAAVAASHPGGGAALKAAREKAAADLDAVAARAREHLAGLPEEVRGRAGRHLASALGEKPPAKPASNLPAGKSAAACRKGRWVTIGAHGGKDDEGKHGGTPVYIGDGGKIERGPARLVGHKPHEIPRGAGKKPKPANNLPSSPEKTTTPIDKPSPVGDNASGGSHGAAPKTEGGKMNAIRLVTDAHVKNLETKLAVTAKDSPHRAEIEAELADARRHLAAKNEVIAAAAKIGYRRNDRETVDVTTGQALKPGTGFVKKNPATGRWEGHSFAKVQAEVGHPGVGA